jgi:tryptophan-rich sensory protein
MTIAIQRGAAIRAGLVLVPLLLFLGGLSARVSGSTEDNPWYRGLHLSPLQPPGIVFPIAWSILYTLIAVAAAIVWGHKGAAGRGLALGLFALQLALNFSWSPAFFQQHLILPSLLLIGGIFGVALAATVLFGRISRLAAWLMVPYLVWLGFATALNYDVWRLNPGADAFAGSV